MSKKSRKAHQHRACTHCGHCQRCGVDMSPAPPMGGSVVITGPSGGIFFSPNYLTFPSFVSTQQYLEERRHAVAL
jgi:hypothetical protein